MGAHAQTLFGIIKVGARPVPRKELVTMVDGVQITLLWFEPSNAAPDTPIIVSLHGIGGDENSVRPIVLAEECLKRGWRSVLYVRRGHGDSSLLPVGALGETPTGTSTAAATPQVKAAGLELQPSRGDPTAAAATPALPSSPPPPPSTSPLQGTARSSPQSHVLVEPGKGSPAEKALAGKLGACASVDAVASIIATASPGPGPSPCAVAVAAAPATPATSVAATGGLDADADADDNAASLTSAGSRKSCLPRNLNFKLPLPFSLGGAVDGADGSAAAAAAAAAAADPEALRRTRKAFPQHADTEDFQAVLLHIRGSRPLAPMVAVGFSMGSNVLVKFLGEQPPGRSEAGSGNPLAGAVSVCNGYDILEGTRNLVSSRPLADRIITSALHKLLRRKLPEVHAICAAHGVLVDFDEVLACNTIREFERALMLPICGLKDVDDYYQHNNCREALRDVSTPLLCLSARDDPIIDPSLLRHAESAATSNPHVLLAVTRRGGHLGWMQGWRGRSWMMDVILQYVDAVVQLERKQLAAAAAAAPSAGVGDGVGDAGGKCGGVGGGVGVGERVRGAVPVTAAAGAGAVAGACTVADGGSECGAGEGAGPVLAAEVVIDVRTGS